MSYKKFGILFISLFIIVLLSVLSFVVIIDPYFHYHKPITNYKLEANKARYLNYGIAKHFDYDALITGSSMTQNFKTSEFDKLFNVNSIKVSLSGTSYKELNDLLIYSFKNNKNIKKIIVSLDYQSFFVDKDSYTYEEELYPRYLYDENIINDIRYIYNKEVLISSLKNLKCKNSTTFDEYANWNNHYKFGKVVIDKLYNRPKKQKSKNLKKLLLNRFYGSLNQNIISLVKNNPNVEFYFFYPPYSIYAWDNLNREGTLNNYLKTEKLFTEELLKYENVHIYSFLNEYDIITNLDNYKDTRHYSEDINSKILVDMKNHKHELTKDNYEKYYKEIIKYYNKYDYDALFK